jgi:electron transfer flavoprotein alpha/beta subunit
MAEYRVYLVGTDGHFRDAIPLICANDAEAIEQALRLAVGHGVELWQLDRKVAVFPDQNKTR